MDEGDNCDVHTIGAPPRRHLALASIQPNPHLVAPEFELLEQTDTLLVQQVSNQALVEH